jgi:hypothetical protein
VKAGAILELLEAFKLKSAVLAPVVCKAVRCLARNRANKEVLTNDCGAAVILELRVVYTVSLEIGIVMMN